MVTLVDISDRKELANLNEMLLLSLPHPAMYIRRRDKVVLAANKLAIDLGARIGGHCWRDFGKMNYISKKDREIASEYPDLVPAKFGIKCSFCLGNKCFTESPEQNNPEVNAFGFIWDIHWVKVSSDVYLHYAINVTDRKHTDEQIKISEQNYRTIFNSTTEAIFIHDAFTGKIIDVNNAMLLMYGYHTRDEVIHVTLNDLSANTESYNEKIAFEYVRKAINEGPQTFEWIARKKDGSIFWIGMTLKKTDIGGEGRILAVGRDITARKRAEEALRESEATIKKKLQNILDPEGDIGQLDLSDIIDQDSIRVMMEDFYRLTNIGGAVLDISGKVLVSFGWQDICAKFHRLNPESLKNCLESDVHLAGGLAVGAFKAYRCKNNLWDLVTPIEVGGKRLGNLYLGQFFYDDEVPDYDLFRKQAIQYGFDEIEYLKALDRVPRSSRRTIDAAMEFCAKLSGMISSLSYSKIKLSSTLAQKDIVLSQLQKSERKFKNLFEEAPLGIALVDSLTGCIKEVNPMFANIVGRTTAEIEQMDWMSITHPDDLQDDIENMVPFNAGDIDGFSMKKRYLRPDGSVVWINMTITRIDVEDYEHPRHLCMIEDITARRQAEKKLRENEEKLSTLFSAMTEMVVMHELVFNEQGEAINYRITDCNSAFTEITGIKSQDALGKLATEVYQTEIPPYLPEFSRVGITGESFEYDSYYAPMDKHFLISVVSPRKNHFATITSDITAFQQIQEVIVAKNKELENFLYITSHDLRSPLVNIQGFSARLQKQTDTIRTILSECQLDSDAKSDVESIITDGMPKSLKFILSNIEKMDSLINGLLQISRTGRISLTIRKLNMRQLFETIIATYNFQLSELGAKVILLDLPECFGDESQLNQLFSNIIGNAIKYHDNNRQLIIEISALTHYNKVVYAVKDTGIGIASRHLDRIWDVFFRVDSKVPDAGEGLGLSLAKRIADNHRGRIWAESEEGKGTVFYVELQKKNFQDKIE